MIQVNTTKQKGNISPILGLILFIIIAGAGVYYLATKNNQVGQVPPLKTATNSAVTAPDETANWKTYTNEPYKISFKYPSSDNIYKCGGESTSKPNEIGGPADGTEKDCVGINDKSINPEFSLTLNFSKDLFETLVANEKKNNSKIILTTISNKPAYTIIYEVSSTNSNKNKQVYIKQSPTEIIYFIASYDSPASIALFDTILSTVKFTDQASSVDTSNWKTYTNTEAKVSFQYPLAWTVKEETPNNAGYKVISIEGKEGKVQIDYGTGFGGACPAGYEDLNIGNAQTQACHIVKDNGSEEWSLSDMEKNNVKFNNIYYGGFVTVNSPYEDNRDLVLNLLSTFKFTN